MRHSFNDHDCFTARFAGLSGLKNGQLLYAADAAGFDVISTVHQSMPAQQDLRGRNVSLVILCAATNRLRDLLLLVPAVNEVLSGIGRGAVARVRG